MGRAQGLMAISAVMALAAASAVAAKTYGDWGPPVSAEQLQGSSSDVNTAYNDGCPILNPYDGSLYIASNRPGGYGGLDIWIAPKSGDGWGTPVNAGPQINSDKDEFCPSPARGNRLFFVRRLSPTNTDIFVSKHLPKGFQTPERLPVGESAINSPAEEWSPSYFEADGREYLYFSSTRSGSQKIYHSVDFGPAVYEAGVNTNENVYQDARPNVRHDGLEIVFDSNRYGTLGLQDIFTASRTSVDSPWGEVTHLGNGINSPAQETRASLSWDGKTLMFGSTRPGEGSADVYVSRR